MKDENAIEVKNLKKSFKVYYDKGKSLKEKAIFWKRNQYENREVLKGISFEVKKGEAIGLIGHNGCGKSTTLKLLTKIIYPDEGSIEMRGRVVSLIELGAGFHPDMSGRENIYTNASIFGLSKSEIDARLNDIIEFSELEEFIDNPVRTYSSGMYMRLAFAVAINVDADILLIDEILAVGDAGFQTKCFTRLKEIKKEGTTIVIVSHSTGQIMQICDGCIWINKGFIQAEGNPRDVVPQYMSFMAKERREFGKHHDSRIDLDMLAGESEEEGNNKRYGSGEIHIEKVKLLNRHGDPSDFFNTRDPMTIHVEYSLKQKVDDGIIGIGIFRKDGTSIYGTNTRVDAFPRYGIETGGIVDFFIPSLDLATDEYWIEISFEKGENIPVDYWREIFHFRVFNPMGEVGVCTLDHKWKFSDPVIEKLVVEQ